MVSWLLAVGGGGNTRYTCLAHFFISLERIVYVRGFSCTLRSGLDADQYLYTTLDISLYERSCGCKMLVAYILAKGESF